MPNLHHHHHHRTRARVQYRPIHDQSVTTLVLPGGLCRVACSFLGPLPCTNTHAPALSCACLACGRFGMQMVAVRREAADAMDDFRRMFASEKQPLLDTIASLRLGAARAEEERERVTAAHDAERR